ncbi:MAG: NAD-dependent epimerase/dehydratase family protein [Planctomycetota bacterium]
MTRPTVFITGVAGFLGSHLAGRFLHQGSRVIGCDNLLGGYRDNVPKGTEFHQIDCLDLEALTAAMKGVDTVYHCAATAYEGLSVFSPLLVTQNIVAASVATFTAGIRSGVGKIVFCSSMARYGTNEVPFSEEMEPRPQDPYGIGKAAAEAYLRNLCQVHGVDWVICVPHNIYGPRQKYNDPFRNVAAIMINLMLQGRQPIIYGDGTQKRCFSFIEDDLPVLTRLATEESVVGEIINIGPDEEFVTINKLAQTIAELLEFELDPVYVAGRPQEVELANCSADKARKLLGYRTRYTLREGLEQTIQWIARKGPGPFDYHLPLEIQNGKCPQTWVSRLF